MQIFSPSGVRQRFHSVSNSCRRCVAVFKASSGSCNQSITGRLFDRCTCCSLDRYDTGGIEITSGAGGEPFCFVSTVFLSTVSAVKEPDGTCQQLSKSALRKEANASLSSAEKLELHTFAPLDTNDCTFLHTCGTFSDLQLSMDDGAGGLETSQRCEKEEKKWSS